MEYKPTKKILFGSLLVLLVIFLFTGCGTQEEPRKIYKTGPAIEWLTKYYESYPLGGGFTVYRVEPDKEEKHITIYLRIPKSNAKGIISNPPESQLAAMASICPNEHEKIWSMLDQSQNLIVEVSAPGYGNFISTDCRSWGR